MAICMRDDRLSAGQKSRKPHESVANKKQCVSRPEKERKKETGSCEHALSALVAEQGRKRRNGKNKKQMRRCKTGKIEQFRKVFKKYFLNIASFEKFQIFFHKLLRDTLKNWQVHRFHIDGY